MSGQAESVINEVTQAVRPLDSAYNLAAWEAAVQGSAEANEKEKQAQAQLIRFWADADRFETLRNLRQAGDPDPVIDRQLALLYLASAKAQQSQADIEQLTELEAEVRAAYYNFRAELDGQSVSDNELDRVLQTSQQPSEVQAAWVASKDVAGQVAGTIRQLAKVRNHAARNHGFRDHFDRALTLDEIDETYLLDLFGELERATDKPFRAYKAELDAARADRFGISPDELMPWHYGDRFFQEVPQLRPTALEAALAGPDPVPLALATYDGLGMDVRDILDRSDLYPRPGKNQHAFCTDIDREGDIRTLNNLEPTPRWTRTLLHELGHGVYAKFHEPSLPWLLRQPSHTLTTEAIAILMESQTMDASWLEQVLGRPAAEAAQLAEEARQRSMAGDLIFTRWVLVMTHFERALYANPDADLDRLWWDLVERYQGLRRPPGRSSPDWAAKYHIALAPVYYHNYQLGALFRSQMVARLKQDFGGLIGRPPAGEWLRQRVFAPGAREDWATHIEAATGEPLNLKYFTAWLA
jgi:peptidyl-dipeptidase A